MLVMEANIDATVAEMCAALAEKGVHTSKSSLDRFFASIGFTRKKRLATR